jgi:hypothetical protein
MICLDRLTYTYPNPPHAALAGRRGRVSRDDVGKETHAVWMTA